MPPIPLTPVTQIGLNTATVSVPITISAGANRLLTITVVHWDSGANAALTGATLNGVAATPVDTRPQSFSTLETFRVVAPASGAGTVQVNAPAAKNVIIVAVQEFTGVDQTTPVGTPLDNGIAFGAAPSSLSPSSAADDLVYSAVGWSDGTTVSMAAGVGETVPTGLPLSNTTGTGATLQGLSVSTKAAAAGATTPVTWTPSGGTCYAHVAFAIKAAAGPIGPAAPTGLSATLGDGVVNLAWTDNATTETGFKVFRSKNGGAFTQLGSTLAANVVTVQDTTATVGNVWRYHVVATNASGDSAPSNTAVVDVSGTGGGGGARPLINAGLAVPG